MPGYADLEDARSDALRRLSDERPESMIGLQIKVRVILSDSLRGDLYSVEDLA